jgi:hypothetical protein
VASIRSSAQRGFPLFFFFFFFPISLLNMGHKEKEPSTASVENVSSVDSHGKTTHIPLWHSIKKFPRIVGYCVALSSAILLYGYDLVIVGTVAAMPQFQYISPTPAKPSPVNRH